MNVKIMFWVERNYYRAIIICPTTKSISCLLRANNMTEFDKYLAVGMSHECCVCKLFSVNRNRGVQIWPWYFNTYYVSKGFTLLHEIQLYFFNFSIIKKFSQMDHV